MAGESRMSSVLALEGQAQCGQPLAAQCPQCGAHLVEEDILLRFVDLAHFFEQLKIHAPFLRHPVERGHVLRETGAAISQPCTQKLVTDPAVEPDAGRNIFNVRIHRFGQVCHGVNERDLHGQKCIRCVLDDLRALRRGHDQLRRMSDAARSGKRVRWA